METLIFLIVIAIIIMSNVANVRKKMKSAGGDSGDTGGWGKSLRKMLDDIKTEMEKSAGQMPSRSGRSSGWDDLIAGGRQKPPEQWQEPEYEVEGPGDRTLMETKAPPRMETKEPPRIETKEPPPMERGRETLLDSRRRRDETPEARMAGEKKEQAGVKAPEYYPKLPEMPDAPAARQFHRQRGAYSIAELQNAVIWSEILGKPVSLRRSDREVWL